MAKQAISVQKEGHVNKIVMFDPASKLKAIRPTLEKKGLMKKTDHFIQTSTNSEVGFDDEGTLKLEWILSGKETNVLTVGVLHAIDPIDPKDGVDHYNDLDDAQLAAVYENVEIFHGLALDKKQGFHPTFQKLYTWHWDNRSFPPALNPRVLTEVNYDYTFSKVVNTTHEYSADSGSLDLSTPYVSGSANFSYEQSKDTNSSKVTQYITGKFLVRKVLLRADPIHLKITPEFEKAVKEAVSSSLHDEIKQYYNLLTILNKWGYYVPLQFTLGGVLFSTDSTTITEYSEAEGEKESFGGSFKAEFDGIGGGASYEHAEGSDSKTSSTNKFQDLQILQIGGKAGTTNDYNTWAKSLDKAIYWNVASYDKLMPSLALISDAKVWSKCVRLMDKYATYPSVAPLQPYLNMTDYATSVQAYAEDPSIIWPPN